MQRSRAIDELIDPMLAEFRARNRKTAAVYELLKVNLRHSFEKFPPMDGVRTPEGGWGSYKRDGPGSNLGRWGVGGGLQAFLGAPMAAYSGCGERDGGRGHGKRRSRTGLARVCGDVQFAGRLGHWRTGAVRPGVEWLATGPRRD